MIPHIRTGEGSVSPSKISLLGDLGCTPPRLTRVFNPPASSINPPSPLLAIPDAIVCCIDVILGGYETPLSEVGYRTPTYKRYKSGYLVAFSYVTARRPAFMAAYVSYSADLVTLLVWVH